MHAAKDIVDTEVGHEDGEECQEHEHVERHGTSENGQRLGMQGGCIHHERDKRPYLLGVPSPVFAPRDVCPDGSDEDADAECGGSRIEEKERKTLQGGHLTGGVAVYQLHGQGCYGIDERQGQEREAHHDDADVYAQQGRIEHRHDVRYLRVHLADVAYEQEETRHEETACEHDGETEAEQEAEQHDRPCHEEHRLIAVCHRDGAANGPAQILTVGE